MSTTICPLPALRRSMLVSTSAWLPALSPLLLPVLARPQSMLRPLLSAVRFQHSKSHTTDPLVIRTISQYRTLRQTWYREGASVGFVPTMGALHSGHTELAREARLICDKVVASVFVNPAQFAPTEDLAKYPRTEENDIAMLAAEGVDVVFAPSVAEMYPSGISLDVSEQVGTFVHVQGKSHQMEGSIRPHFFRGVSTVVSKLFNIIQPTHAFFGQKDVQQCSVIRSMVRDLFFPVQIMVVPTVREADGLAKSSRNRFLSPEERALAPLLYQALLAVSKEFDSGVRSRSKLVSVAEKWIARNSKVQLEYISLAEPMRLTEVDTVSDSKGAILSGAIRVGNTRIIDNVVLGHSDDYQLFALVVTQMGFRDDDFADELASDSGSSMDERDQGKATTAAAAAVDVIPRVNESDALAAEDALSEGSEDDRSGSDIDDKDDKESLTDDPDLSHGDGSSSVEDDNETDASQSDEKTEGALTADIIKIAKTAKPLTLSLLKKFQDKIDCTGVVYLSRIPPFMKPTKVRSLLTRYGKLGRIYLNPEDAKTAARRRKYKQNKRQNFTEGWVEFLDKSEAKRAAAALNNTIMGGKKRSRFHDDIWNIRYLPRFRWNHLTEQLAYELKVKEQRIQTEMAQAKRENKVYLQNVGKAKMIQAIESKKALKRERETDDFAGADQATEKPNSANHTGKVAAPSTDTLIRRSFKQRRVVDSASDQPQKNSTQVSSAKKLSLLSKIF
ncbi:hypothetical protein BASA50_002047 [Batrachochytrium salamandrivorans]|uniref:Pantoate--beta-alanine ligase n=1 Tax=Batrachochytrium salamandrivorans TaxID=1357716 RepID=A0ABQ8FMD2_9FUNG|nr:hypothetical protein BASA50_002047 [Batrachochytrium salamandrivorans]